MISVLVSEHHPSIQQYIITDFWLDCYWNVYYSGSADLFHIPSHIFCHMHNRKIIGQTFLMIRVLNKITTYISCIDKVI